MRSLNRIRRATGLLCLALAAGSAAAQSSDARPAAAAPRSGQLVRSETFFPTGERASSAILLERTAPADVRAGQDFNYELRLTNLTRNRIEEVTLVEKTPPQFRLRSTNPQGGRYGDSQLAWTIRGLGPGAAQTIQVQGAAEATAEMTFCATVTFSAVACAPIRVVEPRLTLQKTMPSQVLLCDDIPLRFIVGNAGSGVARNVIVTDTLPPGLTLRDGKNSFTYTAGDLAGGQSREFTVVAKASRIGEFRNVARASEEGGTPVEAAASVIVTKPELQVNKTGPRERYLGRPATYELTVTNTGNAAARDTTLTDSVPTGTEFVSASDGGQFSGGQVVWRLGALEPGASRRVSVVLRMATAGTARNVARATAYCAEGSSATEMQVRGVPAVLLEVVDTSDPIEVGGNETYVIEVTNQGTAPDTNIVIVCTLPPEMDYVSAEGPTPHSVSGKVVRFAPVPTLSPKQKIVFRVVTRGLSVGDVRFKTELDADILEPAVEETESTHIY